jgi:hypothetical protein
MDAPGILGMLTIAGSLAIALTIAAVGHSVGADDLRGLGLMFAVISAIALSHSISVRMMRRPVVTTTAKLGALSVRYRPVIAMPTFLTCLAFSPPMIVIGYQHSLPQAVLGGVVGAILAILAPIIAVLQAKRAFVHMSPDSIRVTTIFNDSECAWEDILHFRITDHRPGIDSIRIECRNYGVTVHRQIRGFTVIRPGQEWEFSAVAWGASLNSLISTLIFLHENPELRKTLDKTQIEAMLEDPPWATGRAAGNRPLLE